MLSEWRARQALGEAPLRFALPRVSDLGRQPEAWSSGWSLGGDSGALHVGPRLALEARQAPRPGPSLLAEGGVRAHGSMGPLSFSTEVRMTSGRADSNRSLDADPIDTQAAGQLSNVTYLSFSRYRATLDLETPAGSVGFRRDALHWGPGRRYNLVFSRTSPLYPLFYWQGDFGPVTLLSAWAPLSIDGYGAYRRTHKTRSVYAHRYEWRILPAFSVGVSEQLVVYEQEAFAAAIPFVPLFVEKGFAVEREDNGNIAFDLALRPVRGLLLYGEFLIDDMQEPSSLLDDSYWGNRWAALGGASLAGRRHGLLWTLTLEAARTEPWVYAHFAPASAQAAHHGEPLGNPLGPNSLGVWAEAGLARAERWGATLGSEWVWKGSDSGSRLDDTYGTKGPGPKAFLAGVAGPDWRPSLSVWCRWRQVQLEASAWSQDLGTGGRLRAIAWR